MSNTAEIRRSIERVEENHPVLFGIFAGFVLLIPMSLAISVFWFFSWVMHFVIRG